MNSHTVNSTTALAFHACWLDQAVLAPGWKKSGTPGMMGETSDPSTIHPCRVRPS